MRTSRFVIRFLTTVPTVSGETLKWDPRAVATVQHGAEAVQTQHEALCQYVEPGNRHSGFHITDMPRIRNLQMAVGVISGVEISALPSTHTDGSPDEAPYVKADNQGDSTATLFARDECFDSHFGDRPVDDHDVAEVPSRGAICGDGPQTFEQDARHEVFSNLGTVQKCLGFLVSQ